MTPMPRLASAQVVSRSVRDGAAAWKRPRLNGTMVVPSRAGSVVATKPGRRTAGVYLAGECGTPGDRGKPAHKEKPSTCTPWVGAVTDELGLNLLQPGL